MEAIVLLIRHGVNSLVTNHVGQRPADLISDDVIKSQFKAEIVMPKTLLFNTFSYDFC